jgi:type IV secretion system protein VirB1
MLPGIEMMGCWDLAVPTEVMQHVVKVESSFNPYAIGVVGGRLVRQPRSLAEALATVRMLEDKGYNFSLGLAQVNRYNLAKYGLSNYELAFQTCPNLQAGSRILAECHQRAGGDWGKAFSCYYSGNFTTGFRHGYVQKVYASMRREQPSGAASGVAPITVVDRASQRATAVSGPATAPSSLVERRGSSASITSERIPQRAEEASPSAVATARSQPHAAQAGPFVPAGQLALHAAPSPSQSLPDVAQAADAPVVVTQYRPGATSAPVAAAPTGPAATPADEADRDDGDGAFVF